MSKRELYTVASGSNPSLAPPLSSQGPSNPSLASSFSAVKGARPSLPQDSSPLPGKPVNSFSEPRFVYAEADSGSGYHPSSSQGQHQSPFLAHVYPSENERSENKMGKNESESLFFPQPNTGGVMNPSSDQPPAYTPERGSGAGASADARLFDGQSKGLPHESGVPHHLTGETMGGGSINTGAMARDMAYPPFAQMDPRQNHSQPQMPAQAYYGHPSGDIQTMQPSAAPTMSIQGADIRNLKNLPKDSQGKRGWGYSICGCFSSCGTCCVACCCPCMIYSSNKSRIEYLRNGHVHPERGDMTSMDCAIHGIITTFTGFGWILQIPLRSQVRRHYGIRGNGCSDCLAACFCNPCELTQEEREIEAEEDALINGARAPIPGPPGGYYKA